LGIRLASGWSKKSRLNQPKWEETFQGNDKEYLVQFCEDWSLVDGRGSLVGGSGMLVDYFVFGHRHLQLDVTLSNGVSRYINLGQWFTGSAYAKFDGDELVVHEFEKIK
jgi:UDP-2,3-diacylglucosamine hydrolase